MSGGGRGGPKCEGVRVGKEGESARVRGEGGRDLIQVRWGGEGNEGQIARDRQTDRQTDRQREREREEPGGREGRERGEVCSVVRMGG